MKYLLTLITLFVILSAQAQDSKEQSTSGPKIKLETAQHDFGDVNEGTYPTYKFKFYNVGDKPLVLKSVRPGCGCTASDYPREPIMPGDSSTITARFNSNGYGGRSFYKSITVTTNETKNNLKVLYIKGNVLKKKTTTKPQNQSPVRINN